MSAKNCVDASSECDAAVLSDWRQRNVASDVRVILAADWVRV